MFLTDANQFVLPDSATTFIDNMRLPVHGWFRYSAGFSSQLVSAVIKKLGSERVLDPFAGSGTTLLAAQECSVASFGVDVHPFIARVAEAKLCWDVSVEDFLIRAKIVLEKANKIENPAIPDADLIARCFPEKNSLIQLLRIRDAVLEQYASEDKVSLLVWLAFVRVIRQTTPAGTAQWQYVLPKKHKKNIKNPLQTFNDSINMIAADMRVRQNLVPTGIETHFQLEDAKTLECVPDGYADTVITSPPYANNYDYADTTSLKNPRRQLAHLTISLPAREHPLHEGYLWIKG